MTELKLDQIYDKDVVFTAAYVMIEKAYFFLRKDGNDIIAEIEPKKGFDEKEIMGEFKDQLINYAQHLEIARQNKDTKAMILQEIFSGPAIKEEEIDDPDGILVPWEEKYGKDNKV